MTVMVGLVILVITLPIIMSAMVKWTYPYVNDKMYQKSMAEKDKKLSDKVSFRRRRQENKDNDD